MRVMHQVTGCDDCPLFGEECRCQHPLRTSDRGVWSDAEGMTNNGRPDWCPLAVGELLIQLVARKS